jgi:alpha-D-xyloside xylohydrolase
MNNYLGTGARYLNAYSLMTTEAVYKGQRSENEKQRVFILTRSAFAGQQRNSAASWSGDISATWKVFHNQIAGGLNLTYTGLPYWTTDIGGFFVPDYVGGCINKEYQELFTRWYQFGAFCPIFRVHGTNTPREIYQFGEPGYWAYDAQLKFDNLRYRLMPYIYSVAWMVTNDGYTMMRGLNFDFRTDQNVKNIADEYMFGPSFLVAPVTECLYYKDLVNVANQSKPIPASCFSKSDGKPGLEGSYFNGKNFESKVFTRTDTAVVFDWGTSNPGEGMVYDNYSIKWEGFVTPEEDGEYVFITYADDGARLWVDNKKLVDDWTQHGAIYLMGRVKLEANKKYPVKMEYNELIGGAGVSLLWITPSQLIENHKLAEKYNPDIIRNREVYLPESKGWYDFWTGKNYSGGQNLMTPVPMDIMPLFIKAGSIVPMGPYLQYSTEKPADPLEIRIYAGADCSFVLYEDENDNYNYEKGVYSTITFNWKDSEKKLDISERNGNFPGMLKERTFNIIMVSENHGNGQEISKSPDKTVIYNGKQVSLKF